MKSQLIQVTVSVFLVDIVYSCPEAWTEDWQPSGRLLSAVSSHQQGKYKRGTVFVVSMIVSWLIVCTDSSNHTMPLSLSLPPLLVWHIIGEEHLQKSTIHPLGQIVVKDLEKSIIQPLCHQTSILSLFVLQCFVLKKHCPVYVKQTDLNELSHFFLYILGVYTTGIWRNSLHLRYVTFENEHTPPF